MSTLNELALDELRAARSRLSDEVTRLVWLRRLLAARRDLEVARLLGVAPGPAELPADVRDALVPDAPPLPPETLRGLADGCRALDQAAAEARRQLDDATRTLVERYAEEPARCLSAAPLPGRPGSRG